MSRENMLQLFRDWLGSIDANSLPPEVSNLVDQTECYILRHQPTSAAEALMVVEVLIENMRTGGRSDGLDLVAAHNLQGWLSRDLPGGKKGVRGYARLALAD